MATIQKLPVEVRSYLRSGVTVTSVTQCVEELLLNSVDAGATCVAVRVDLQCFKIQVVDNGSGVPQDQLKLLGERYATSKCRSVTDLENLSYFGYRGEALASIRESCSVLEITTKTKGSSKTDSKLFQDGKPLEVIESTIPRPSVGTTVTVHDLFSNFPVRKKSTNASLELERIRQRVEALALLRPAVSISLRNDTTGTILVQTHKCSNSLLTFKHLYGSAKADILVEISSSKSYFTVEGYLGKEGHSKKDLQFVYVNGRLVLKTRIHKLVNKMLINSAIFKRKYGSSDATPNVESKSVFVKSPGRQIDRYPVFVLNIKCPLTKYDITFDPSKTLIEFTDWDSLLDFTKELLNDFLKNENLECQEEVSESTSENVTAGNEKDKSAEKVEKKMLGDIISPSNLRHTLFSKPAKRKSEETHLFKTPVSISIEEWKAGNKTRKVCLNETEDSSLNRSDVGCQSDSNTTESSAVNDDSQVNNEWKTNKSKGTATDISSIHQSKTQQSGNKFLSNSSNRPNENMDHLQVINEKGDNNPCQRVLESQKLKNKAVEKTSHQSTNQNYELLSKAYPESTCSGEGSKATVSITSRSSLSEFRRKIGKPVTDKSDSISVDNKLKENFIYKLGQTTVQEVKYTSSLQQFKRQFMKNHQPKSNERYDKEANLEPCIYENLENGRRQTDRLNKSVTSVTDSRLNHNNYSGEMNRFQNAENDYYPGQSFHGISFDSNPSGTLHSSTEYASASNVRTQSPYSSTEYASASNVRTQSPYERNQHAGHNNVMVNRKRVYPAIEKETVAYKLSKLSKQKTATISVTSTCGASRSPLNAEISCGDNAVVTVVSESEDGSTHRKFPPPCATVTSDNMNNEFQFNPVFDTRAVDNNFHIPNFSEYSSHCDINKPDMMSTHDAFEARLDPGIHDPSYDGTSECIENTNNIKSSEQDYVKNICDNIKFTAEKLVDDSANTCYEFLCTDSCRSGNESGITETLVSHAHCYELSTEEDTHENACEIHDPNQMSSSHNKYAVTNNEPIEFSAQGFSPCINENETGLSQTMNDINISVPPTQSLNAEKLIQSIVMSPCSMGFSPCMSVSPASLPDTASGDSQGFTALSDNQENQLTPDATKDNNASDSFPTEIENVARKSDRINNKEIATKSNSTKDTKQENSNIVEVDEIEEINCAHKSDSVLESKTISGQIASDSHEQSKRDNHIENSAGDAVVHTENAGHFKAVPNTENESEELIVRISQLLPSMSQPMDKQSSHTDSMQCQSDIHFTDIFPPSTPERNVEPSESENSESQDNIRGKYQSKNSTEVKGLDENVSSHLQVVKEGDDIDNDAKGVEDTTDANDDTMMQPTPDNSGLFSSWDCSCGSGISDANVVKENEIPNEAVKTKEQLDASLKNSENEKANGSASKVIDNNVGEKDKPDKEAYTLTEQRRWIQMKDPKTGKKLYIHSLLGTTITEEQWIESHGNAPKINYTITETDKVSKKTTEDRTKLPALTPNSTERLHTLMSDYIATGGKGTTDDDDEDDAFIKWRGTHTPDSTSNGPSSVEELFAEWSNPVFESTDKDVINTEVSALPKSTVKAYRTLNSCKFTKEMLNTVKVVGQVDKKFIACLMKTDPAKSTRSDMLAVIDQHAAHERIRLELLTEESYVDCDVESGVLEVFKVDPPKSMELTGDEVRVVTSFQKEFKRIGVNFHCDPQSRTKIFIETIPACIMEKDVNYVKSTRENIAWNIVKALLKEHIDLLVSTGGVGVKLPSVLHKALCSQACHGAIKFGDSLTLRECEALIRDLSRCDLPFQCAHGRPSVMPVLQLEQLRTKLHQEKQRRPKLYKLTNAIQIDQQNSKS